MFSSEPVTVDDVCLAMVVTGRLNRGREPKIGLHDALRLMTLAEPRYVNQAIGEALKSGLIERWQTAYHLSEPGRHLAEAYQLEAYRARRMCQRPGKSQPARPTANLVQSG